MKKPEARREAIKAETLPPLSTRDWLNVARETLIREGVEGVKIDRLAKLCGVTRGGFYWRFQNREDLLRQLLEDWRNTNTAAMLKALAGPERPEERFQALMRLWIDEREYRPDYDVAVRNWALSSSEVAAAVHEADDLRIAALHRLFLDAGYEDSEAFIRARITYFHQVGYYAMGVKESRRRRTELSALYYRILTGFATATLKA